MRAVAVDPTGRYMVTSGADCQVRVWDVRTFKSLHDYHVPAPATSLAISQRGMLSLAYGRRVQAWKDALTTKAAAPYLNHTMGGGVASLTYVPYEDVLVGGHAGGVSTMLVPGSGEPNFDSLVADPYAGKKARQEAEVGSLLDKLQANTIVLDPEELGRVRQEPGAVARERQLAQREANAAARREALDKSNTKKRMKVCTGGGERQHTWIAGQEQAEQAGGQEAAECDRGAQAPGAAAHAGGVQGTQEGGCGAGACSRSTAPVFQQAVVVAETPVCVFVCVKTHPDRAARMVHGLLFTVPRDHRPHPPSTNVRHASR